ncbi:hypothetical protein [Catellatospora citrea]|uniref:Uncharacterized protein n=1 Tax=Catellatospora citrea TaxID=53366 RepID=A0A8J3KAR7_9ACTN|nr:hypothetical protein [Catellatospora citrea]RKE02726.1 hypothetical protein C8E86_8035 [Catellatospora citrea]GIF99557.1 hypothetical protein Cci01nite_46510 [Catellatospora citrea]
MNDRSSTALARLRAADPAPPVADPHDPYARAMLDRVLAGNEVPPLRPRPARRRWAMALAGTAVFAAAGVLALAEPWAAPAEAYSVATNADGSVEVSFDAAELTDPAKLNAALARAGARTVVMGMVPDGQCAGQATFDVTYELPVPGTPEFATSPIEYRMREDGVFIIIRPQFLPAAETLVIGYSIDHDAEGRSTMVRPVVVMTVPACLTRPTPPAGTTPN